MLLKKKYNLINIYVSKHLNLVQEKIDTLNERLERECYGSGERNLPLGDVADFPDTKSLSKQKCKNVNN